jgi:hypothetical protein
MWGCCSQLTLACCRVDSGSLLGLAVGRAARLTDQSNTNPGHRVPVRAPVLLCFAEEVGFYPDLLTCCV